MEVPALWRHAVKPLQGERLESARFEYGGLVASAGNAGGRAEYFADATDDNSQAIEWTMPAGRHVDSAAVLVLSTTSLRTAAQLPPTASRREGSARCRGG